ncbi:hypothetical protein MCERHM32_00619 [Methylophilaceae bacterium]
MRLPIVTWPSIPGKINAAKTKSGLQIAIINP